jgi:hypothetical protein
MSRYDAATGTTDYQDVTPAGPVDPHAGSAPGTDGVGYKRNDLDSIASAVVTVPGASSVPGPQPVTNVDRGDTQVPAQTDSLGLAGLCAFGLTPGWSLDATNAGRGRAAGAGNPNAGGAQ